MTGTGNPADGRPATDSDPGTTADLSLGVKVQWLRAFGHNSRSVVMIRPGHRQ